jgi:hypothetical protein
MRRDEVKKSFGHRLTEAYSMLPPEDQILSPEELSVLQLASHIYALKGFEYVKVRDSVTGYERFPELNTLDSIARKLLGL